MNYKYFSTIILCVIGAYVFSVAFINFVVDPFYIFRTPVFKVQHQINERYTKIERLRKGTGKYNSFIMGSSRMLLTHPDTIERYIPGGKFYNLATRGATPFEHLLHVKYLIKNGYSVKNLYIGLDIDKCFTTKIYDDTNYLFKLHPDVANKSRVDFYWSYLSIFPKGDIKRKLRANFDKGVPRRYEIEEDGTMAWESRTGDRRSLSDQQVNDDNIMIKNEMMKWNLEALGELVALCKQKDIKLTLFITPHSGILMNRFAVEDYVECLRELSEITPFWDFSGYNSVTTNNKNYLDRSHYNRSVSCLIAARIFGDKTLIVPSDFGVWVTKRNIDAHLENVRINFKNNRLRNGSGGH